MPSSASRPAAASSTPAGSANPFDAAFAAFGLPGTTSAIPPPVPVPRPRPPSAPAGSSGLGINRPGLADEARTWDQQAQQMAAATLVLNSSRINVPEPGPFEEFVATYNEQVARFVRLCQQGNTNMQAIAGKLRAVAIKVGAVDDAMATNLASLAPADSVPSTKAT